MLSCVLPCDAQLCQCSRSNRQRHHMCSETSNQRWHASAVHCSMPWGTQRQALVLPHSSAILGTNTAPFVQLIVIIMPRTYRQKCGRALPIRHAVLLLITIFENDKTLYVVPRQGIIQPPTSPGTHCQHSTLHTNTFGKNATAVVFA